MLAGSSLGLTLTAFHEFRLLDFFMCVPGMLNYLFCKTLNFDFEEKGVIVKLAWMVGDHGIDRRPRSNRMLRDYDDPSCPAAWIQSRDGSGTFGQSMGQQLHLGWNGG